MIILSVKRSDRLASTLLSTNKATIVSCCVSSEEMHPVAYPWRERTKSGRRGEMVLNRRRDKVLRLEGRAVRPVQPESPSKVLLSVNPSLHVRQQPPPLASLHLLHSPPLLPHLHCIETDLGAAWPVEPAERDSRSCQHLPVPLTLGCSSRWSWDFLQKSLVSSRSM